MVPNPYHNPIKPIELEFLQSLQSQPSIQGKEMNVLRVDGSLMEVKCGLSRLLSQGLPRPQRPPSSDVVNIICIQSVHIGMYIYVSRNQHKLHICIYCYELYMYLHKIRISNT